MGDKMKILISTINSKYIHVNNSVYIIDQYLNVPSNIKTYTLKDNNDEIIKGLTEELYDYYFFSVYVYNINKYLEIWKQLKKVNPNCKIIIGGPEVSYDYEYLFNYIDIVFRGEVNETINEIVNNCITSNHIVTKESTTSNCNYNTFMHEPTFYNSVPFSNHRVAYIETSKGCPYKCSYCMSSLEQKVYTYEMADIYKIINYTIDNNVKTIKFLDRTFNVNEERAIAILDYISNNAKPFQSFQFEIAPEIISQDFLNYLINIKHTMFRFEVGIQSIFDKTINAVDRFQTFDSYKNVLKTLCDKTNIVTHLDLIAGLPYETYELFIQSFNETFKLKPDEYQLGILKILNGTKIKSQVDLHGIVYEKTAPYTIIQNNYVSKEELQLIHNVEDIVDRFYNSNKFKNTFTQLIKTSDNCYNTLLDFSNYIQQQNFKLLDYQLYDIFKLMYNFLSLNYPTIKDYVILDYLQISKTKPKRFYSPIDKQELNTFLKSIVTGERSLNYLYKYVIVEKLSLENETYVIKDIKNNCIELIQTH